MKTIKINKSKVKDISFDHFEDYHNNKKDEYSQAGIEAYKLYAYISTLVDNTTIVEVGTRHGKSALSLSYNPTNTVITYDIVDWEQQKITKENIVFKIQNFMQDKELDWSKVDVIMIDVDPHDGIKEREFMQFLYGIKWEGLLLLDDILPNWPAAIPGANPQEMNNWWNSLTEEKYDLSEVGHFSGTGLVVMGNKFKVEVE